MKMKNHEYQYEINSLLAKDEAGVISSFALQLESILLDGEELNQTGIKVLDESLKLLHELLSNGKQDCTSEYEEGYRDGFGDSENGHHPQY